jgi:hypothetical protein
MEKGSVRSLVNTLFVLTLLLVGWFYATTDKNAEPSIDYSRSLQGVDLIDTPSSIKNSESKKPASPDKISHADSFSSLNRKEIIANIQQTHPSLTNKIQEISNLFPDDFIDQNMYYSILNAESSALENFMDMYVGSDEEPVRNPVSNRELTEDEKRELDPYHRLIENPEMILDSIERNESPTASRDPNNPYAVMLQ